MLTVAFVVAGYLSGSLTWGYWLVRGLRGAGGGAEGGGEVGAPNGARVAGARGE